ncbi:choice-of-anchor B family protein [Permianibacter sp. IMCC34836]|uniref:choice-of-anchor B family protein n=1 Tax=Permianibacter fluminis TaxID=2738515 RepID=UPI001553F931|nr:choice-of-anchor B family protein [Permianibacter fluminis]NQD36981.1 choice-of-anchor B family protein [Permianibacter fluminis]
MNRPRLRQPALLVSFALAAATGLVLQATPAHAHGSGHATRYVAADGVDRGHCATPTQPCQSIAYALGKSGKGDTIHVAEGTYHIRGTQRVNLLAGVVPIEGGYSRADNFAKADRRRHPTQLTGVPFEFREQLESKGFQIIQDSKGGDIALNISEQKLLGTWQKVSSAIEGPANCEGGVAGSYNCNKMDLLSHIPLSQFSSRPESANDIWGFMDRNDGHEYALIGLSNGTAVVDITDPTAPHEVGTVTGLGSLWRDVHVYQYFDISANRYKAYAYVTTEAAGGGVQVIDLTALPTAVSLAYTIHDVQSAHTLYGNFDYADGTPVEGLVPTLFIAGSDVVVAGKNKDAAPNRSRGSWRAYDMSNPAHPVFVHQPVSTGSYMHDSTGFILTDERTSQCAPGHNPCEILFDFNEDTLDIWDVTERANPTRLAKAPYGGVGYAHSGWFTADKRHLILDDELDEQITGANSRFRTFDLNDLHNPVVAANYYGPTTDIDHNTYIRGSRGYVAHYRRGVVVLDVSNPLALAEAGSFDSSFMFPSAAEFNGVWGTYPFFPSGSVVLSDIENGLYVVRDNTVAAGKGRLGFGVTHYRVNESAGSISIPVYRSGGASGAVSARIVSADGSAVAGSDYQATDVTLNWADGERGSKFLTLPLLDDSDTESAETVLLNLTVAGGAETDIVSQLKIDLISNEQVGALGFAGASSSVAENAGTVTLTVQRFEGSVGAASIHYQTEDGSALAGSDYDAASGTLNWAGGDASSKTITVTLRDDSSVENDESFAIKLSAATGAAATSSMQATVTVHDNDGNPGSGSGGGGGGAVMLLWLLPLLARRQHKSNRLD